MLRFLKNNGLSLAFWLLFAICIAGQALLGYGLAQSRPHAAGRDIPLLGFVGGPDFLKGVFGNWQAALLQLFALVVFAVFLRQRGASHSRKMEEKPEPLSKHPLRRSGSWLFRNSLSLVLGLAFLAAFVGFFFADLATTNDEQVRLHQPIMTGVEFATSCQFWFDVLQTWQAEFFAMALFLVLTIVLRQENSAESKPVWATDDDTGEHNE